MYGPIVGQIENNCVMTDRDFVNRAATKAKGDEQPEDNWVPSME